MIEDIYIAPSLADSPLEQTDLLHAYVEFAVDHQLNFQLDLSKLSADQWLNLQGEMQKCQALFKGFYGMLSIQGPSIDLNPISSDADIAQVSQSRYIQAIQWAKELHARYLILPSHYSPTLEKQQQLTHWLNHMTGFWERFIQDYVSDSPLIILLENIQDDQPKALKTLISRVDSPHLKMCMDTGALNLYSKQVCTDWLDEVNAQTAYIQMHNNNGEFDEHEEFGKGTQELSSFLNHLALLSTKYHIAIEVNSLHGINNSYQMILPYLQIQQEQFSSKSFLV